MNTRAQRILASYPLIWNTRIFILLPLLALIHLIAFAGGWMHTDTFEQLPFETLSPAAGIMLFAILAGMLLLIGWLVFYLRNNALKSLYPVSRSHMMAEYGIIFIVCIGSIAITESYSAGLRQRFQQRFNRVDIVQQANTVNLASQFLVFDFNDFYHDAGDSTRAEPGPDDGRIYTDTIPAEAMAQFSFLNYRKQAIEFYPDSEALLSAAQLQATAHRWLLEGRRDSIRQVIGDYLKLVHLYGGNYRFNTERWVNDIFSSPGFRLQRKLNSSDYSAENDHGEYISIYQPRNGIDNIHRSRHLHPFDGEVLFVLLAALELSLVVLSFRLIQLRPWIIALIGSFVWMVLFGLFSLLLRESDAALLFLFVGLHLAILLYAARSIAAQTARMPAGVAYVWTLWSLPFVLPMLAQGIASAVQNSYTRRYGYTGHTPPVSAWINNHMTLILYLDMVYVVVLTAGLLLPLARRWQAMPEE